MIPGIISPGPDRIVQNKSNLPEPGSLQNHEVVPRQARQDMGVEEHFKDCEKGTSKNGVHEQCVDNNVKAISAGEMKFE